MSSVASIDVPMAMGHLDTAAALLESAETKAGTIRSAGLVKVAGSIYVI